MSVAPIPPVREPSFNLKLAKPLTTIERRYAEAAWHYFQANYHLKNGLIDDRSDFKGATLWGLGDYLAALHAARSLDIISPKEFDQRTRHLLGALTKLPLYASELPSRGYDTRSLQPVDYGGNPVPEGNGWSSLDIGRMLAALYNLKTFHPEYAKAVDKVVLDWSYLRVVRDGILSSATVIKDKDGRTFSRINPEIRLGYEEYAARAFQLWGFSQFEIKGWLSNWWDGCNAHLYNFGSSNSTGGRTRGWCCNWRLGIGIGGRGNTNRTRSN